MKLTEIKRGQIIDAAVRLFAAQGVAATSMDQVAAEAQVSKRTVYNHFATKTELFHAVLLAMFSKVDEGLVIHYQPEQPIAQQLSAVAAQEVALLTSPAFMQMAKVTFLQLLQDPELAQSLHSQSIGCLRFFAEFLRAAKQHGSLAIDDVDFAAKQFVMQLKAFLFYPPLFGFEQIDEPRQRYVIAQTVQLFLARYQSKA